jgi:hypothetical protein
MWSWHIWVTPLVSHTAPATDLMINRTDNHYNFMQYNLGWATATNMNYGAGTNGTQPRDIRVRVKQTGISNPATETFIVTQTPVNVRTKGTNPYWQWGRKDPMPPSNGLTDYSPGERQLWFGMNNASRIGGLSMAGPVSIGTAIKDPFRMIVGNQQWCSTFYTNLWDAPDGAINNTAYSDIIIVKTVYDPNPVGFKMPPGNAWTRLTLTGENTSEEAQINASNVGTYLTDGGYRFYTQKDGEGETVLYQNTGLRYYSAGNLRGVAIIWSMVQRLIHKYHLSFIFGLRKRIRVSEKRYPFGQRARHTSHSRITCRKRYQPSPPRISFEAGLF